jgi:hypothetical protein
MGRVRSTHGEKRTAYRILVALPFIRKREREKERKVGRDDRTNTPALP